jgi:predicted CoA-substrate-specific enzyme activase
MSLIAGIDLGNGTTKCVITDENLNVIAKSAAGTKADFEAVAGQVLDEALAGASLSRGDLAYIATTGLGRYSVSFRDIQITEITCGAKGAYYLFPSTKFVLDIGAQSTRAIKLRENGRVKEFQTNEKCAAGSGSFLEKAAKYLEVPIEELGERSLRAEASQPISSVCAVLAESEIINHVSEDRPVDDIIRGIHESLADRAMAQLKRIGFDGELTLIGGVALQAGMVEVCKEKFGVKVNVPEEPSFVAALGAAILGRSRLEKKLAA